MASSADAEIPSEEDVLAEGKAYSGNLAIGASPKIPEKWCRGWYSGKLGYRQFAWERWRQVMKLDFEKDFRDRRPQALEGIKKDLAGGSALDTAELREALRVASHLKDEPEIARLTALLEGME